MANLVEFPWEDDERKFLEHFESPVLRQQLFSDLMRISMKTKESAQQYGQRFENLMRRTGCSDNDD